MRGRVQIWNLPAQFQLLPVARYFIFRQPNAGLLGILGYGFINLGAKNPCQALRELGNSF